VSDTPNRIANLVVGISQTNFDISSTVGHFILYVSGTQSTHESLVDCINFPHAHCFIVFVDVMVVILLALLHFLPEYVVV
jgi:hypothetical protein